MALATALPFGLPSHHLALPLFGFAQELGDSAGGRQVRRSGLIEALGRSVMGQGRSPWSSPPENIEWGPSFFSRTELLAGFRENAVRFWVVWGRILHLPYLPIPKLVFLT